MAGAGLCYISSVILLPFTFFQLSFVLCVMYNLVYKLAILKMTTRPSRFYCYGVTFLLDLSTQETYYKIG